MKQLDRASFRERYGARPLFGMVHLLALPGSPAAVELSEAIRSALEDARSLAEGGAAGIVIENFGDRPFQRVAGRETIASMTRIIYEIRQTVDLPVGVNVLRNDGAGALAVAAATGASFIRVNVLVGGMLTDQGIIEGAAAEVLRERARIAPDVHVFGDHMVKHAAPIAPYDEDQLARDLRHRGLADAVLITGRETGAPPDPAILDHVRSVLADAPLIIASGADERNVRDYADADAIIAGTSIKRDGALAAPVDPDRVRRLAEAFSGSGGH